MYEYTYFWSDPTERHTQGIAIADQLLPAVKNIRCVSESLMSLRLWHSHGLSFNKSTVKDQNRPRAKD